MNFFDPALDAYSEAQSSAEPAWLRELGAETRRRAGQPREVARDLFAPYGCGMAQSRARSERG